MRDFSGTEEVGYSGDCQYYWEYHDVIEIILERFAKHVGVEYSYPDFEQIKKK